MKIHEYLMSSRELVNLCSHNGWIALDTLRYHITDYLDDNTVIACVEFEEITAEEHDAMPRRVACFGRLCLHLDPDGQVQAVKLL